MFKFIKLLLSSLCICFALCIVLISPSFAAINLADYANEDPVKIGITIGNIQQKIKQIEDDKDSATDEDKKVKEDYQAILRYDISVLEDRARQNEINQFIKDKNKGEKEVLEKTVKTIELNNKVIKNLTLDELLVYQADANKLNDEISGDLNKIRQNIDAIGNLSVKNQEAAANANNKILEIKNYMNGMDSSMLRPTEKLMYSAQINSLQSQLSLNEYKLSNSVVINELLLDLQQEYIQVLSRVEEYRNNIQTRITELRRQQTLEKESLLNTSSDKYTHSPFLSDLNNKNLELYKELEATFEHGNIFKDTNKNLTNYIKRTNKIEQDIENQIKYFDNTVFLSQVLFNKRYLIPNYSLNYNLTDEINEMRLKQYDYSIEMEESSDISSYARFLKRKYEITGTIPEDLNSNEYKELDELLKARKEILTSLYSELSQSLNDAVNVQINYQKYNSIRDNFTEQIYKQIFWSPSNRAISKKWFVNLPNDMKNQWKIMKDIFSTTQFGVVSKKEINKAGLIAFIMLLTIIFRKKLRNYQKDISAKVSKLKTDRQWATYVALLIAIVQSIKYPLAFICLGHVFNGWISIGETEEGIAEARNIVNEITLYTASVIMLSALILRISKKDGIGQTHLKYPFNQKAYARNKRIFTALALLAFFISWKICVPQTFAYDVSGQFLTIGLLLYVIYEISIILKAKIKFKVGIWSKMVSIMFIGLLVFDVVLVTIGYFYSALVLAGIFIKSYFLMIYYNVCYMTVLRSVTLAAKRVTLRRRIEHRQQNLNKKTETQPQTETLGLEDEILSSIDDEISVNEISYQSRQVVKYLFVSLFIVLLYQIWGDIIQVTSYAKYITVYTVDGENGAVVNISLMNILYVCYAILITYIVSRNFPGVLEVLVFNRFTEIQKYSYSIVTIMTYVIIAICVIFCCNCLGLTWDKLQWLVAALSVGLGFGLQEIFANFISGLILLFERPIRIGDYITIDGHLCRVVKIRIRSTTIIDFDRKEYIVPNKEFITSKITNWSLEPLTRVILKVGVGYGSDVAKVKSLLMQIASENQYVMKDPKYSVVFRNFGDSNLDFELRIYVKSVLEMTLCTDSINTAIYDTFNREGIEIAFNQMDVYIKNVNDNQEIRVQHFESANVPKRNGAQNDVEEQVKSEDVATVSEKKEMSTKQTVLEK